MSGGNSSELACVYAALALHDDGVEITSEKIASMLAAAGVTVEPYWPSLFAKLCQGKDLGAMISSIGSGARAPPARSERARAMLLGRRAADARLVARRGGWIARVPHACCLPPAPHAPLAPRVQRPPRRLLRLSRWRLLPAAAVAAARRRLLRPRRRTSRRRRRRPTWVLASSTKRPCAAWSRVWARLPLCAEPSPPRGRQGRLLAAAAE